jgi:acetoin utilization protein AcuC
MDLARALGWLPPDRFRPSLRAKPAALTAWHTPAYVAALQRAEEEQAATEEARDRHALGTTANPVFPEMFRRPATGVGGVMLAADLLAAGEATAAHVPGGGTHHAFPDRANGFCYLNDPVFAVLALRARGFPRVAYVDIDAHHCDGVDHAFRGTPEVLVLSTHEENRWPRTGPITDRGAANVWNLPVPSGLHDDDMARIADALIAPAVAAHRPDAIVLQCGSDGVEEDPQARLALSNNAHALILRTLRPLAPRLVLLGGGGYNPWSVGRCWAGVWGTLNGFAIPERLPPAAEAVLRGLRWDRSAGRSPPEHWFTTLRDAPRPGVVRAEVQRLAAGAVRDLPEPGVVTLRADPAPPARTPPAPPAAGCAPPAG